MNRKVTALVGGIAAVLAMGVMGCNNTPEDTASPAAGGGAMSGPTPVASPAAGGGAMGAPPGPGGAPK